MPSMHRCRLPFVPAKNSQHRIAVFALYRALLRSAQEIPLPQDLQTGSSNCLRQLVKKGFARNRAYTSLRLAYASLAKGYKFLALFSRAHSSSSAEFGQIVAHVRSQRPRLSVTSQASTASPSTLREPFLKNISTNGLPKYTTTYVLRHGSRKPSLCATADGQPFIRSKKPQPAMLSKMIGRKGKIFKKKITNLVNIDDGPADAALEDQWDRLMMAQMNRETIGAKKTVDGKLTETFTWSTQLARLWWELKIDLTWQDWLARGEALHQYMQDQKTLDEKANTRVGEAVTLGEETVRLASKVAVANLESTSHAKAVRSLLKPGNVEDPFVGPAWITLVQSQERRLLDEVKKRVK